MAVAHYILLVYYHGWCFVCLHTSQISCWELIKSFENRTRTSQVPHENYITFIVTENELFSIFVQHYFESRHRFTPRLLFRLNRLEIDWTERTMSKYLKGKAITQIFKTTLTNNTVSKKIYSIHPNCLGFKFFWIQLTFEYINIYITQKYTSRIHFSPELRVIEPWMQLNRLMVIIYEHIHGCDGGGGGNSAKTLIFLFFIFLRLQLA